MHAARCGRLGGCAVQCRSQSNIEEVQISLAFEQFSEIAIHVGGVHAIALGQLLGFRNSSVAQCHDVHAWRAGPSRQVVRRNAACSYQSAAQCFLIQNYASWLNAVAKTNKSRTS